MPLVARAQDFFAAGTAGDKAAVEKASPVLQRPGERERLDFSRIHLMSIQFEAGSRIVAVLHVIKEPVREINYGSGKEVFSETLQDAGTPLEIKWYGNSYLDLPVSR